jgi:hypothetical protein
MLTILLSLVVVEVALMVEVVLVVIGLEHHH